MDVRSAERVQVALFARLETGTQTLDVEVRDLSATGAMLSSAAQIGEVGDVVKLSMELTFGAITRQVSTAATVCNCTSATEVGEDGALRYGVQFDDLAEVDHI